MEVLQGRKDLTPGAVITDPGNTQVVETGSWRTRRPVVDWEACVHCMICWLFCPDSCFQVSEQKLVGVDLEHCKGCGICAVECPKRCIQMVEEAPVAL